MAKKYYAVKSGRETGIFTSWDECKRLVTGFKGAQYKGFDELAAAQAYLDAGIVTEGRPDAITAYVDGSYNVRTKQFAYGAVIFHNGEEVTLSDVFSDEEMASMRNVAGEIMGAQQVMLYCVEHNINKLDIYYDYAGIEKWCTGEWKTTKKGTSDYKAAYDWVKQYVDIRFIKVKGHSGDKYNDMADMLAKKAAGNI